MKSTTLQIATLLDTYLSCLLALERAVRAVLRAGDVREQLALSGVVRLDPELKVLSENERKRKDGYCLRVKLQAWSNPEQGGQGRVFRHWEVIRAATGTPVREGGAGGAWGAGFASGRGEDTVSIGGREVQRHFPASELEQILAKALRNGHRLPVPSVTRTWANGRVATGTRSVRLGFESEPLLRAVESVFQREEKR